MQNGLPHAWCRASGRSGCVPLRGTPIGRFGVDRCTGGAGPRGVDQVLFRPFVRVRSGEGHGKGDVLVDRIGDQRRPIIWSIGLMTELRHGERYYLSVHLEGAAMALHGLVGATADI